MSESQDYLDGLADGHAGKDPDPERLAYGWNRMNDYEKGYVAAGPSIEDAVARVANTPVSGKEER